MTRNTQNNEQDVKENAMHSGVRTFQTALVGLALIAGTQASAFTLDSAPAERNSDGSARLEVRVQNGSGRAIEDFGLLPSAGLVDECGGPAGAPQRIESGSGVDCVWQVPAAMDQASLGAWVRYANGEVEIQRIGWTQARGGSFPQAVLALVSSGVHDDTDLDGVLDAGETVDYAYRLINLGSLALDTLAVTDLDGAVSCPASTLAVNGDLVCTSSHVITVAEETAGLVENVIEATGFDGLGLPVQSSDQVIRASLGGRAGIAVLKSPFLADDADGSGFANLGDIVRYDFIATNTNEATLSAVELIEPDPSLIDTPITCEPQTFGGNAFAGNGTGVLAGGDSVRCIATYEIRQADVDAGQALNLVQAFGSTPLGLTVNGSGASALVISGPGALTVEKIVTPPVAQAGQTIVYTVTVSNTGPVTLFDVQIIDPLPVGIASFDWTCAGVFCPNPSGTGAINELIPAFPGGETVVYTVDAVVGFDAPPNVLNVVTVLPPGLVECQPDGTPTPCEADAGIEVVGEPIGVPAMGRIGVLFLLLGVAVIAIRARN